MRKVLGCRLRQRRLDFSNAGFKRLALRISMNKKQIAWKKLDYPRKPGVECT
ncbi:hypothetical protein Y027_4196 [Burkholderia pseudomallei TSV5]|nr:hypothetical protein Y027_4196 [Burkholderia pseudomallei TSV5]KGX56164.1 hypothetical protein Y024_4644 [Burkholderia pseudomallei TSV44]KGX70123.1 hypothetical protein Y026_884 [Burkholderia pseudomallei TSV28]